MASNLGEALIYNQFVLWFLQQGYLLSLHIAMDIEKHEKITQNSLLINPNQTQYIIYEFANWYVLKVV